jgi:amidohydrolase
MWIKLWIPGLFLALTGMPGRAATPAEWFSSHKKQLIELYRDLHQHPELSTQETRTAARIAAEWTAAGYAVTPKVGGTGVVGMLKNGKGPILMLRTELDALPVTEATELPYASTVTVTQADGTRTGVMHACGHDVHMTSLTATAHYLFENRQAWRGTLMLVAQPAEERVLGARAMLADGLYSKFAKPDVVLALHVDGDVAAGTIGYTPGYAYATVDAIDITLHGRGGHGAAPHTTIDPIVMGAQLVLDLQTLVSRETNPLDPAVITVGSFHAGTKRNIISDKCKLQLTVRSYSETNHKHLVEGIHRKALAVAQAAGAPPPEIRDAEPSTPAVFNDSALIDRLLPVWRKALGESHVEKRNPLMASEDFSLYRQPGIQTLMLSLGAVAPERLARLTAGGKTAPTVHSAVFYPDIEPALQTGLVATATAALAILSSHN